MKFRILLGYILGYVNIEVEGYFIEKFINICNSQNIFLWNFQRITTTIVRFNIGIEEFKKIRKICGKTKCRVKILGKKGLPFIFHKYRKRKILLMFVLLILLTIYLLSTCIWNIEIIGNEKISNDEINEILEENNFKIGTNKSKINAKDVINQLRFKRNDISWAGIEISGTNAVVKIVEANLKPEIIKEEEYCNIVAIKPGIISKVSAQNGTALVENGDIVKKGDELVAGWIEGKYTGKHYVHANAEIKAKTWYSKKVKQPFKNVKKIETGNLESKYSVMINNFQINLSKGVSKFKNYDTIETNKKLRLFNNIYLPINIIKKEFKEYILEENEYSLEDATNLAIEKAKKEIEKEIKDKESIRNTKINKKQNEKFVEVEVIYEVEENIGTKEKIEF